jgi:hypothetical protein
LKIQFALLSDERGAGSANELRALLHNTADHADIDTRFDPRIEYADRYTGLGRMPGKYIIRLKPDAVSFTVYKPRRVPVNLLAPSKAELEKLEAANVIKRIGEPAEWCTSIVVVPKRFSSSNTSSGSAIRLCVNLIHSNNCVQREQFSLPIIDQLLARLARATVYCQK